MMLLTNFTVVLRCPLEKDETLTNLKEKIDYSLNFWSRFFKPISLDGNLKFTAKICSKSYAF